MKRLTVLLIAATALFLGHAQAQRVNLLCSPDLAWCEALGPAFTEATGIDLEFIRVSSNDALARIRAEAANPIFDVWFGGTGDPHLIAAREGLTEFWINGEKVTDFQHTKATTEGAPKEGYIAFQVHGGESHEMGNKVRFRNIRIKELN